MLIQTRRSAAYAAKDKQKLDLLWPDVSPDILWNRKENKGFTTIPRTLSLISVILDHLSEKGKPVSSVYFDLWCRANDHSFVKIEGNSEQMAQSSGFSGQRAVNTWTARLKILESLGFIKFASGSSGPRSFVLILNPHLIIIRLKKDNKIPSEMWNSLQVKATDIGATDALEQPPRIERKVVRKKASGSK